jgi:hypothetical protein
VPDGVNACSVSTNRRFSAAKNLSWFRALKIADEIALFSARKSVN